MKYKWNIEFENVGLTYPNGYEALKKINLKIDQGEFVGIIGLSGAGKTTLLKTINKMNTISQGKIYVGDRSQEAIDHYNSLKEKFKKLQKSSDKKSPEFIEAKKTYLYAKKNNRPYWDIRRISGSAERKYKTHIGMVFQRYNLIYKASVLNNVMTARLATIPWWRATLGLFTKNEKRDAFESLAQVNILKYAYQRAEDLSGGQMQRVALARTLTQGANIILADEPVGALDPVMAKSVMQSFLDVNLTQDKSIIINLHHVDLALQYTDRIVGVRNGEIVYDGSSDKVTFNILKDIYGDKLEGFGKHEFDEIKRKRQEILKYAKKVKKS